MTSAFRRVLVVLLLGCGSPASDGRPDAGVVPCDDFWHGDVIGPGQWPYPSLGIDRAGGLHVAYSTFEATLGIAERAPGGDWRLDDLAIGPQSASLAVDAEGGLHVSAYTVASLVYASRPPGGSWVMEDIDVSTAQHVAGTGNSIVVDEAGGVHVTYIDSTVGRLAYADRGPGGEWTVGTLADDPSVSAGPDTALAIDAGGGLHAVYRDLAYRTLRYAKRPPGGTWTAMGQLPDAVDVGTVSSLAVDRVGSLLVGFERGPDPFPQALWLGRLPPGGSWTVAEIDPDAAGYQGGGNSLAVAPAGDIYLSYSDAAQELLTIFHEAPDGAWDGGTLGGGSGQTSIAADAAGGMHVIYYRAGLLRYAYRCPAR